MSNKMPDIVKFSEKVHIKIRDLKNQELLEINIFEKLNFIDFFMLALTFGYQNNVVRTKLIKPKDVIPVSQFQNNKVLNYYFVLFIALKYNDGDEDILNDEKECFKIAEEVANAGCEYLFQFIEDNENDLEEKLRIMYDLNIKNG